MDKEDTSLVLDSGLIKLSVSEMNTFRKCPEKWRLQYREMLYPSGRSQIFQRGTLFHSALEFIYKGMPIDGIQEDLSKMSKLEQTKLLLMINGYVAYWLKKDQEKYRPYKIEHAFDIPLRMPETGEVITGVRVRGYIDMLTIDKKTANMVVMEHKTTMQPIKQGDPYWADLKLSPQAGLYYMVAQEQGWNVDSVVYNVAHVPTLRQKNKESLEAYKQRCLDDMVKNPSSYYGRQEFKFTDDDLRKFQRDLYLTWKLMEYAEKNGVPRYTSNCRQGYYTCEYFDLCTGESDPGEDRWKRRGGHQVGFSDIPDVSGTLKVNGS